MFSIGEFSKMAGLTVKTLRFYHEQGVLVPAFIDEQTGYRYYNPKQVETAQIIAHLRSLEFTLEQIGTILANPEAESDMLSVLERQKVILEERAKHYRRTVKSLDTIIRHEREAQMAARNSSFQVEEKVLEPQLVAGVRMQGRYCDCGNGFAKIGKALGRHICGPCFLLHYDAEFKEEDAEFETCMPVRKAAAADGISVRELPGGRCVSLLHQGPYNELGRSYARILGFIKDHGYEIVMPTREIYLKGPGMIFRGNPQRYLTEIQILVRNAPG